jgi:hypothetical protein
LKSILAALIVLGLDHLRLLLNLLDEGMRANDILQILQQTHLLGCGALRLHQTDLLNLALKNQETIVVKINAAVLGEGGNFGELDGLAVQLILGSLSPAKEKPRSYLRLVRLGANASNDNLRARNDFVVLTRLFISEL